ncbi:glycosyltransferase family 4 protein [Alteromonas macleodii]|uniref:glycosyltransferase family 4 protein n=1 Tax=Alteromonas macleodii TaxID=28108 RepID=UPI002980B504|nr:glycosyltransferase family 4 protein [Alteromonas macleodii]MDW5285859.1 glycosyltransferase family 4 protein [Alteromonas macleodii]
MKIVVIGLRGIPDVMGGIESHCQNIYPRMKSDDFDITVIGRSPYLSKKTHEYEGVKVRSVWAVRNKFLETFLHTFIAIFYARLFLKPNVIHLHAIGPALFTPLARLLGMKVVVTHHGADYDRQKWNSFAKSILKFGEKMGVVFTQKMFVVGKSLTARLQEQYPKHAHKIHYVPNGMLPSFTGCSRESDLPSELNLISNGYIVTVGRLVPEKGFHNLINAYKNASTQLKLVIVGNTDHEDEYSMSLKAMASENIIFAGRRSGSELKALYQHAKVFVLPSYHEGLPIVALEAISSGTNVLLSNIVPNLDIEAPEDTYFEVGNEPMLTKKLNDLEVLNLFIDRDKFLTQFDWDKIALDTKKYIQSVFESEK